MLIESLYYEMAEKRRIQWETELAVEQSKMTEEEILEKKKQMDAELEEIIRRGKELEHRIQKIPNVEKIERFNMLQKASLQLAKSADMNITIMRKDDDAYAYINLSYGDCWFIQEMPKMCKRTMALLFENADRICEYIEDNRMVKKFEFELVDELEVEDMGFSIE